MGQLAQNLIDFFSKLSEKFGTGVVVNDLMLFLLFLGFIAFLFAVAAFRHTYNLRTPPGIERVNMINGKVEKVEMNLGEFRIETVRNLELFRGDLGYIKQELSQISSMLKILSKGGGSHLSSSDTHSFQAKPEPTRLEQAWGVDDDELPSNPLAENSKKKV